MPKETSSGDRLGKPVAVFDAKLKAIGFLVVGLLLGGGGAALLIVGLGQEGDNGLMNKVLGALLLVGGVPLIGNGLWNFRTGVEIRRKGIRLRSWSGTVEIRWEDVTRIEVTNYVRTRDRGNPDTTVRISGRKGQKMFLSKGYMRLVRSPSMLIKLLKEHSQQEVEGVK